MLIFPKTKLNINTDWLEKIKFFNHDDTDLAGTQCVALKSYDRSSKTIYKPYVGHEKPSDFQFTELYDNFVEIKNLCDFFKDLERTRIRINKQPPGIHIEPHIDDQNINCTHKNDLLVRSVTALSENEKFIYIYKNQNKTHEISLKKGETVIFDPDEIYHGIYNFSENEYRYSLVQIFKAFPISSWLKDFIYTEQTIKL